MHVQKDAFILSHTLYSTKESIHPNQLMGTLKLIVTSYGLMGRITKRETIGFAHFRLCYIQIDKIMLQKHSPRLPVHNGSK